MAESRHTIRCRKVRAWGVAFLTISGGYVTGLNTGCQCTQALCPVSTSTALC